MKSTKMPLDQEIDKENVTYLHNGELYSIRNNILKVLGKWMNLENIILNEVTQT